MHYGRPAQGQRPAHRRQRAAGDCQVARSPRQAAAKKNSPDTTNPESSANQYGLEPLSVSTMIFFGSLSPLSFASPAPRDQTVCEPHAEENRRSDRHDQPKCRTSAHGILPSLLNARTLARDRMLSDVGIEQTTSTEYRGQPRALRGAHSPKSVARSSRIFLIAMSMGPAIPSA